MFTKHILCALFFIALMNFTSIDAHAFLYPQMFSPVNAAQVYEDANAAFSAGNYEQASALYTETINTGDLSPEDMATAYENRGRCNFQGNRPHQALADLRRSIEIAPYRASAFAARAQAWKQIGNAQAAQADARQALKQDPANAEALLLLQ